MKYVNRVAPPVTGTHATEYAISTFQLVDDEKYFLKNIKFSDEETFYMSAKENTITILGIRTSSLCAEHCR
jgi:hypothetical protein